MDSFSRRLATLFLCGDVMPARGIDQILPHPSEPLLHESFVKHAMEYKLLAERTNGPIPMPVDYSYPWGEAIRELERRQLQGRIINLETAITRSRSYDRTKGIHYKMHPLNVPLLTEASIDCCILSNNHVLDWGKEGLLDTLSTLKESKLQYAGAGANLNEATAPAILTSNDNTRILIFAFATESSGVPTDWAATERSPGVSFLSHLDVLAAQQIGQRIQRLKRPGDIVIVSIHWGSNWGYSIPAKHKQFARDLIAISQVDIIHGHSSHHPLGIEVYRSKLILYGCGDFLNDYEGIQSHLSFRGDLAIMYFPTVDCETGNLVSLNLVPLQIKNFRLCHVDKEDVLWLLNMFNREGREFGTQMRLHPDNFLELQWRH